MITQGSQRQQSTRRLRRLQAPGTEAQAPKGHPGLHPSLSPAALHLRRRPPLGNCSTPGGVAARRRPNPRRSRRTNNAPGAIGRRRRRHHAGLPRRRPRSAAAPGHYGRHRAGLLPHPGPVPQPTSSSTSLNSASSVLLRCALRHRGVRFRARVDFCSV